jgi:ElaB/YqjD/DUF883 family membrane-anchored ribosome-binding protein
MIAFRTTCHITAILTKKTMTDSASSLDNAVGTTGAPSVSQAANDLRVAAGEKAREFVHTAESKASAIKERAIESAQHFRQTASEKSQHLREAAVEQWQETRVKAQELHSTAEDYIRQNPTKCVLGALGVGFLIGLITRR